MSKAHVRSSNALVTPPRGATPLTARNRDALCKRLSAIATGTEELADLEMQLTTSTTSADDFFTLSRISANIAVQCARLEALQTALDTAADQITQRH